MLFYSVVLGAIGPVLAYTVPPIRERFGYRPPEPIPTTYPRASFFPLPPSFPSRPRPLSLRSVPRSLCPGLRFQALTFSILLSLGLTVPKRPRRPVQGYEDEE